MSGRELSRVEVLGRVKGGHLRLTDAARLMGVSYRQAKRLWRRFRRGGAAAVRHRLAGRVSNRGRPGRTRQRVLGLIRQKYSGDIATRFGPTLVAEHLASEDGITVDHETVRRWMLEAGLWSRRRRRALYRQRRERKAHFGELVQLDGSFHAWYEGRGPQRCLLTMVDDATSHSEGRFSAEETIWAAAGVLRRWIERHGRPLALYTDWKNVYVRPPTALERAAGPPPLTQFGRMCAALEIGLFPRARRKRRGALSAITARIRTAWSRSYGAGASRRMPLRIRFSRPTTGPHTMPGLRTRPRRPRTSIGGVPHRVRSIASSASRARARSARTGWCGITTARCSSSGKAGMRRRAVPSPSASGPTVGSPWNTGAERWPGPRSPTTCRRSRRHPAARHPRPRVHAHLFGSSRGGPRRRIRGGGRLPSTARHCGKPRSASHDHDGGGCRGRLPP